MPRKTLLIVGGSVEAVAGIKTARELGYRVVVSDLNPAAPGFRHADGQIIASTYDPTGTVAAVEAWCRSHDPIDGVICLATDVPHTVAAVAEAFGLPGISPAVAALAIDKLAMKQRFRSDGIPVPWFSAVESADHLREIIAERRQRLVLKPVDSRGGRGVLQLDRTSDLAWAFGESLRQSPSGRVMAEEFLSGPQVSTESIILDGVAYTPGFADRNYEFLETYAPYFIENGGCLPSHLPVAQQQAVCELVDRAARSLGVHSGVVKGDIVVCDSRPYVIELAARLSGGYFCTHSIPLNTGVSTIVAAVRLALGEPVDSESLRPKYCRGVAQRYLFAAPGRVTTIRGVEAARQLPGIEELLITVAPGDIVGRPSDSNGSQGMVLATGADYQQATQRVLAAVARIQIVTEPL